MYELILFGILYFAWILYSLDLYFAKTPNSDNNKHTEALEVKGSPPPTQLR